MKNLFKLMTMAIASFFVMGAMTSCTEIDSESLVGTWKLSIAKHDTYLLLTLDENGKGELMEIAPNGDVDDEDVISRWFYDKDEKMITVICGDDAANIVIEEVEDGGDKLEGRFFTKGRRDKADRVTMVRVK